MWRPMLSVQKAKGKKKSITIEDHISKWIFIVRNPCCAVIFPLCPLCVCLKCVPPFCVFQNGNESEATSVWIIPQEMYRKRDQSAYLAYSQIPQTK